MKAYSAKIGVKYGTFTSLRHNLEFDKVDVLKKSIVRRPRKKSTLEMECDIEDLIILLYPYNSPKDIKKKMDLRYPDTIMSVS